MKILVLDNYDSFTYNLVQYIEEILDRSIDVRRNDEISLAQAGEYDTIILSPGPGLPKDAGIMIDLIKTYAAEKNILGICLGHQAIGQAFGASLHNLSTVYHGVKTPIYLTEKKDAIFNNIEKVIEVGRYHSWVIEKNTLPADFVVTSLDAEDEIMSISHKTYNVKGLQFHPESILTEDGRRMLFNFLNLN
jgi:anthranilate synthase component II